MRNVTLSMDIANVHQNDKVRQFELLEKSRFRSRPNSSSYLKTFGGSATRVAIARALSYDPKIILQMNQRKFRFGYVG